MAASRLTAALTLLAATMLVSAAAYADPITAREMLPGCKKANAIRDAFDQTKKLPYKLFDDPYLAHAAGQCFGEIDALVQAGFPTFQREYQICVPLEVTYAQVIRQVIASIERRPDKDLDLPFVWLAIKALHDAYPCQTSSR